MKIAIVGAGAAGLVASIILKSKNADFTLFERGQRAGKKLLATGNGRCNLTNLCIDKSRYHGSPDFAEYALTRFGSFELTAFFESIGVPLKAEGDKVYPYSLQASSVLDMLRLAEGMCELCDTEITKIIPKNKGYILKSRDKEFFFDKVILACGGCASPNLSGGGAYNLLTDLGHKLTPLKPAIVQLKCEGTKALDGVKVDAKVKMDKRCEEGEVLFTSYGLSGPPILQLSRDAVGKKIVLDLTPDLSYAEIVNMLTDKKRLSYLTLENLFTGFLNKKLGREILKRCDVLPFSRGVSEISDKEIKSLASTIKGMEFLITGTNGLQNAQVTAGGIDTGDFNPETMESRLCPGIFAAGEMLDVDGDCGGFNLQWAFSSAYVAALSAIGENLND